MTDRIPKIIHYCWFGGNPKPKIIKQCIASWKKYCPDWEIIEWNEDNFDISSVPYMKEAYEAQKWAFVSDVARLIVLYKYGGVYLDTDVEILVENPFEQYLGYENVLAFETERVLATGLIYISSVFSELTKELLNSYKGLHYKREKEVVNSLINKPVFVKVFPELKWNGQHQIIKNTCFMSISEYNQSMKHYGTRSWGDTIPNYKISNFWKIKAKLRNPGIFLYLENNELLKRIVPLYEFLVYDLLDLGVTYYVKRIFMKQKDRR